jgi:hypothetical protein
VTIVPSLVSPMLDGSLVLVALRDSHQRRLVLTGPRDTRAPGHDGADRPCRLATFLGRRP